MTSKHQYSSDVTETHSFTSKLNNQHSFLTDVTNTRIFNIIVDAFKSTNTLFAKFTNQNIVTINPIHSIGHLTASFISNNIVTVTQTISNLSGHLSANVINNNIVTAIIKSFRHMDSVTSTMANNLTIKIKGTIHVKNVNTSIDANIVTATIIGRKYYLLSDWDGSNLSTLDSMNLSAMDYQIV